MVVLAGTNNVEAVDMSLRRPGRFDREVEVPPPQPKERVEIFRGLLSSLSHDLTDDEVGLVP